MKFFEADSVFKKLGFKNAVQIEERDLTIEKGSLRNYKQVVESIRKSSTKKVIVRVKERKLVEKVLIENNDQSQQAIPLWRFKMTLEELFGL